MTIKFNTIKTELLIFPPNPLLLVFHFYILPAAQNQNLEVILDASISHPQ